MVEFRSDLERDHSDSHPDRIPPVLVVGCLHPTTDHCWVLRVAADDYRVRRDGGRSGKSMSNDIGRILDDMAAEIVADYLGEGIDFARVYENDFGSQLPDEDQIYMHNKCNSILEKVKALVEVCEW